MPKRKKKIVDEWYLCSAACIGGFVSFIGIELTTGTPQVVAAAIGGVILTILVTSKNWKNFESNDHKVVSLVSFIIFIAFIDARLLLNRKS